MKTLTRADLDDAQCQMPGCTHKDHAEVFLTQRCHPSAGVDRQIPPRHRCAGYRM